MINCIRVGKERPMAMILCVERGLFPLIEFFSLYFTFFNFFFSMEEFPQPRVSMPNR
jgi:hypothetical protein